MLRTKYPIAYELDPPEVEKGIHWLRLKLKNIGNETLIRLDVQMHSLDTLNIQFPVSGAGQYFAEFKPGEEKEGDFPG